MILARARAALTSRAARRRADLALYRLATNRSHRTMHAARHLARLARSAADQPRDERHPDYCHTCRGFCGSKAHR